jgi:hypothetical protein
MAYVSVPRDMTAVKSRLLFGLTRRQLTCFGIAAAVGAPTFILVNSAAGSSIAMLCLIITAFPAMVFAVYEKDGVPAEKILFFYLRAKFFFPATRPYKVENIYDYIEKEGYFAKTSEKAGATPTHKAGSGKQEKRRGKGQNPAADSGRRTR